MTAHYELCNKNFIIYSHKDGRTTTVKWKINIKDDISRLWKAS